MYFIYIVDRNHQRSVIVVEHFRAITSRKNQSSASLKSRNYAFTKTWKLAIAISYLKINKRKSWGFHARENFSEKIYSLYI